MNIAESRTFQLGPYIVRQRPRFDNPAFAVYKVFRSDTFIGDSFSIPDLGCCEWLERTRGVYATPEENYQMPALRERGAVSREWRHQRLLRKSGRQRKVDADRELAEAIADG